MAEDPDAERDDRPSLELPSFALPRLRRRDGRAAQETPEPPELPATPSPRPRRRLTIPAAPAAALTGALMGLLLVGAVRLALSGCEALRGTSTCGGPGVFVLLAILLLVALVSTLLLSRLGRQDAGTVTLLGVGITAVIALAALTDHLLSPWMLLVIPALSVVGYLVGHWLTTAVAAQQA